MAAISIAYAFGEGIGRLACMSFGCCYGKPIHQLSPWMQRVFNKYAFVFSGQTKKIAYADGLAVQRVLPVQGITAIIYGFFGIVGLYLFLKEAYTTTFITMVIITQTWRFLSEFLRADHRGGGKITVYQWMGLISIFYALFVAWIFPMHALPPKNLLAGLRMIWQPGTFLGLQCLFFVIFVFMGRSQVTGATLSFRVLKDRI